MKLLLIPLVFLCFFCPKKEYIINETQYTKSVDGILYLDVAAIVSIIDSLITNCNQNLVNQNNFSPEFLNERKLILNGKSCL